MEVIIYIGIVITLLGFKLWWDYRSKRKGIIINHFKSAMIDGVVYFLSAYILFCYPGWCSIGFMFGIMFVSIGFRWVFFDLLFNKLNGWKWNHYGESAWQDRQLQKLKDGFYIKIRKKEFFIKIPYADLIPKIILIIIGILLL